MAGMGGAANTPEDIRNAVWSDDQEHGPADLMGDGTDWSSLTPFEASGTASGSGSQTATVISGQGLVFGFRKTHQTKNGSMTSVDFDDNTISWEMIQNSTGLYPFNSEISFTANGNYYNSNVILTVTGVLY
jgi:hypothetical protein